MAKETLWGASDAAERIGAALLTALAGLALSRLLYEAAFPYLLWLARPLPIVVVAVGVGLLAWLLWPYAARRGIPGSALLPLLLNLLFLVDPDVDLTRSRFLFAAGVWLSAVFIARAIAQQQAWRWLGLLFLLAALMPIYLLTMSHAVGRADTFEFQVVAPQLGIAHPTGYPLYLLLGKLFTLLPVGSVAWRLNLASAVYALAATGCVYLLSERLLQRPLPALFGAVALGLTPTFWSQAIEAEVYTLHALFVAAALLLMGKILTQHLHDTHARKFSIRNYQFIVTNGPLFLLAFLLGLGLTNHLTTLFLLPPAAVTLLLAYGPTLRRQPAKATLRLLLKAVLLFALPLLLYAYLPLRWQAVVGEPMGATRFVDWVIGGRFQGALQLTAWHDDPARYAIVGRLLLTNWGWTNLGLSVAGFIWLGWRQRRLALVLLLTWLGFSFYALNYYVPDLAVFLIAADVVVAVCLAAGFSFVAFGAEKLGAPSKRRRVLASIALLLALMPTLLAAVANWPALDRSQADGLLPWGRGVLSLPLEPGAAILADSEKIAPLYYLQQAEGVRPDLEIMVLPDEAAYRAELEQRVAAGQTVYLARFVPGLAGRYHLRAVGPLTQVSNAPLTNLPSDATAARIPIGPLQIAGYQLETTAAVDEDATAVTLYWKQATDSPPVPLHVYTRLTNEDFARAPTVAAGQHPVHNYYPITAWHSGEVVSDYHLLLKPVSHAPQVMDVQVALAPPFTPADELDWHTVTRVTLSATSPIATANTQRAQLGGVLLSGASFPAQLRSQTPLSTVVTGYGEPQALQLKLMPAGRPMQAGRRPSTGTTALSPFSFATDVQTDELDNGRYRLQVESTQETAVCGWLRPPTTGCPLGEIEISGVPLPAGATNFDDKIALLAVELAQTELNPGGQLPVALTWQSLAPLSADYTLFIQVLNDQDRIVGQIDTYPRQGTYPTSQWQPGEIIEDNYLIQLDGNLPLGQYKLHIGWYLLATLQRLPVLNDAGVAIDDKLLVEGLTVP